MSEIEKGLEGIIIGKSAITFIDGLAGVLRYRGINIKDLAKYSTFEEVAYLLWRGKLPTKDELGSFQRELSRNRIVPSDVLALLKAIPTGQILWTQSELLRPSLRLAQGEKMRTSKTPTIEKQLSLSRTWPLRSPRTSEYAMVSGPSTQRNPSAMLPTSYF